MGAADTHPYLQEGIIAYIGNKRRLLHLIGDAVALAAGRPLPVSSSPDHPRVTGQDAVPDLGGLRFADLFAGSGIVSRYARFRGMEVLSNDWEPYAEILSRAWLEPRPSDIIRLFGRPDGLQKAVEDLNRLPEPREEEWYLARYFAPASRNSDEADYRKERLFYTRSNALKLDAARNRLETMNQPVEEASDRRLRHSLLLAPLLYAAATNVNTSGVFKAYHHGFGGHGRDALSRITGEIRFRAPVVVDRPPGTVFSQDAEELAASGRLKGTDVVYLDPPYNQHQYGSNYHLLNTLVHWDRIPEPLDLGPDGRLLRKAGIRPDWVNTRSPYCSRRAAEDAFSRLLDNLDAPLLLISYSTDGIIPFQRLREICENYGRLTLTANPYVTYRGGRQSRSRQDANLEFVLIVEKGRRTTAEDRRKIEEVLIRRRLQLAFRNLFRPEVLKKYGDAEAGRWQVKLGGRKIMLPSRHLCRLKPGDSLDDLSFAEAKELNRILDSACCRSREEELEVICRVWESCPGECRDLIRESPRILRKLAYRKYEKAFNTGLNALKRLGSSHPDDWLLIADAVARVEDQARRRIAD